MGFSVHLRLQPHREEEAPTYSIRQTKLPLSITAERTDPQLYFYQVSSLKKLLQSNEDELSGSWKIGMSLCERIREGMLHEVPFHLLRQLEATHLPSLEALGCQPTSSTSQRSRRTSWSQGTWRATNAVRSLCLLLASAALRQFTLPLTIVRQRACLRG